MQISKKVVILGHFGVGKTSLIRRIVDDCFSDNYEVSIGVNITKKNLDMGSGNHISLILWDLEGTDDLNQIRDSYLLGTHAVIYVFDVSRPSTYDRLAHDLSVIGRKTPDVPIRVVGNKIDLTGIDAVAEVLTQLNIPYDYLTSAKTGNKVDSLFERLAKTLVPDAATIQGEL